MIGTIKGQTCIGKLLRGGIRKSAHLAVLGLYLAQLDAKAAPPAPPADPLGRDNPRSAVTGFLEACQNRDYQKAAQYLDLRQIPVKYRDKQGSELAKELEGILNSDTDFNVLHLNRNPEGDLTDDTDPNREHVSTVTQDGHNLTLDLERVTLQPGNSPVWVFSHDTVIAIPHIHAAATPPAIETYLPPFLVSSLFLDTPFWKWLALAILALLMISLSRLLDWLIALLVKLPAQRLKAHWNVP